MLRQDNKGRDSLYHLKVIETRDIVLRCIAYGIFAEDGKGCSAMIPNISCDKAFVTRLAERCARGQLNPEQLLDIVTDVLLL